MTFPTRTCTTWLCSCSLFIRLFALIHIHFACTHCWFTFNWLRWLAAASRSTQMNSGPLSRGHYSFLWLKWNDNVANEGDNNGRSINFIVITFDCRFSWHLPSNRSLFAFAQCCAQRVLRCRVTLTAITKAQGGVAWKVQVFENCIFIILWIRIILGVKQWIKSQIPRKSDDF